MYIHHENKDVWSTEDFTWDCGLSRIFKLIVSSGEKILCACMSIILDMALALRK